jgi:DNA gyrase subunit A
MLFSNIGKAVRFHETQVRVTGRVASGVRGIRLQQGQCVQSLLVVSESSAGSVLSITENGYGKRTVIDDYVAKSRGGRGVISIKTTERNGNVVGALIVDENDELMLISNKGTLIRTPVRDVSIVGRNTHGVTLVKLPQQERLVSVGRVAEYQDIEQDMDTAEAPDNE